MTKQLSLHLTHICSVREPNSGHAAQQQISQPLHQSCRLTLKLGVVSIPTVPTTVDPRLPTASESCSKLLKIVYVGVYSLLIDLYFP